MVIQGMGYEVDYLPVGEGGKSGDAIAVRWGYLAGGRAEQRVIVIDGGTKESGQALVKHIDHLYGTDRVDLVICTHWDADHASGLSVVIEELQIGMLLMHEPWQHAKNTHKFVTDGRVTERSLTRRINGGLEAAHDLWELARRKRVHIVEPFSGTTCPSLSVLIVLGPDRNWYKQLLSKFRCVPNTQVSNNVPIAALAQRRPSLARPNLGKSIAAHANLPNQSQIAQAGATSVPQAVHTAASSPTTSAENNSSAIMFLTLCGHDMVFTGDAGVEALTRAITYGEQRGLDFSNLHLFHVPHHVSEHNVDPHVLANVRSRVAVVSTAPDGAPKHPSSRVTNALIDHGAKVFSTQGSKFRHKFNAPHRPGWIPATPVPYDKNLSPDKSLTRAARSPLAKGNPRSIAGGY